MSVRKAIERRQFSHGGWYAKRIAGDQSALRFTRSPSSNSLIDRCRRPRHGRGRGSAIERVDTLFSITVNHGAEFTSKPPRSAHTDVA